MGFLEKVGNDYKVLEKQMERLEIVLAEPMNIDATEFGFSEPEHNRKQYLKYAKRPKTLVHEFSKDIGLYRLSEHYIVFDDSAKSILYFVHFKTKNIFGHKLIVQVLLWRSHKLAEEKYRINDGSVTGFVFFDCLLRKEADGLGIAADTMQTPSGKRFWLDKIAQAFGRGLYVFLVDQVAKKKIAVNDYIEFEAMAREWETWSDKQVGMVKRVVISEKKLW